MPKTPQRPASSHTRLLQSAAGKEPSKGGAAGYIDPKAALLGASASAPPAPELQADALLRERVASAPQKKKRVVAKTELTGTHVVSAPVLKVRNSASAPALKNAGAKVPKGPNPNPLTLNLILTLTLTQPYLPQPQP